MVLVDQVVGEIIVKNVCVLCELEKTWINRLQTYKELTYYNDYILNRGYQHKFSFDTFHSYYLHMSIFLVYLM